MLEIKNLHVSIDNKPILNGINLSIAKGEIHALMGPNGSGKSTLASVLAGKPGTEITQGEILFQGKSLSELAVEERSQAGLFLAFQYPVEIPGVTTAEFLKTVLNEQRKQRGLEPLDALEFQTVLEEKAKLVDLKADLFDRALNEGFSGGEKKRLEMLQLALLNPTLAILDETDSGLDIDALKTVAQSVNAWQKPTNAALVITHYQRILEHLDVDHVHILVNGTIVKSGGKALAKELEQTGYENYLR